jgi:hypothetical protein
MLDWLSAKRSGEGISGETIPGMFWDFFVETDWNTMILGKNQRGKYSILKPRYQYFLTDWVGSEGVPAKRAQIPVTEDARPGLMLLPHTPHTIRTTVRSCESCHESDVALGLGDPARRILADAESFLSDLQSGEPVPPEFQTRQMVTSSGDSIQTVYPTEQTRFLSAEEIAALKVKSDTYKAYRYMDLRDQRFPRLLMREEFPFDRRHQEREKSAGEPEREEDTFYHMDENRFISREHLAPGAPQSGSPLISGVPGSSQVLGMHPEDSEMIIEFSPEFFETAQPMEELTPEENGGVPFSDSTRDGF